MASPNTLSSSSQLTPSSEQTLFYFVVFPSNSSPIVHSNRIPADLVAPAPAVSGTSAEPPSCSTGPHDARDASSEAYWRDVYLGGTCASAPGVAPAHLHRPGGAGVSTACPSYAPVGDYCRGRGVDEVPQLTLQTVAFPSAFGAGSVRARPPSPRRVPRLNATPSRAERAVRAAADMSEDDGFGDEDGGVGAAVPGASGKSSPLTDAPPSTEGPPWYLRLEEVCTAGGQLRHYRIILTTSFAVMISSHTGALHSMQTQHSAVALVLVCPAGGHHYRYLLQHFDLVRALLHRLLAFGMRVTEKFFRQLFAARARAAESGTYHGPQQQQRVLRNLSSLLEKDPLTLETYADVKAQLARAFTLFQPLPPLRSTTGPVLFHLASHGGSAHSEELSYHQVSSLLCAALSDLAAYGRDFLSAFIAGLLAVAEAGSTHTLSSPHQRALPPGAALASPERADGRETEHSAGASVDEDPCAPYWASLAAANRRAARTSSFAAGADVASAGNRPVGLSLGAGAGPSTRLRRPPRTGQGSVSQCSPLSEGNRDEGYTLRGDRAYRVVIFSTDSTLAQRLMVIATFILSAYCPRSDVAAVAGRTASPSPSARAEAGPARASTTAQWLADVQGEYERAVAARVPDCTAPSTPVQWVTQEFSETHQQALCSSVFSLENAVLLVSPRLLMCRRVQLRKTLTTATLTVEQTMSTGTDSSSSLTRPTAGAGVAGGANAAGTGSALPRSVAADTRLFRCRVIHREDVPADPLLATLVQEAVTLEQCSGGAVSAATVLQGMLHWLRAQRAAVALRTRRWRPGSPTAGGGTTSFTSRGGLSFGGSEVDGTDREPSRPRASTATAVARGSSPMAVDPSIIPDESFASRGDSPMVYGHPWSLEDAVLPGSYRSTHLTGPGPSTTASPLSGFRAAGSGARDAASPFADLRSGQGLLVPSSRLSDSLRCDMDSRANSATPSSTSTSATSAAPSSVSRLLDFLRRG